MVVVVLLFLLWIYVLCSCGSVSVGDGVVELWLNSVSVFSMISYSRV